MPGKAIFHDSIHNSHINLPTAKDKRLIMSQTRFTSTLNTLLFYDAGMKMSGISSFGSCQMTRIYTPSGLYCLMVTIYCYAITARITFTVKTSGYPRLQVYCFHFCSRRKSQVHNIVLFCFLWYINSQRPEYFLNLTVLLPIMLVKSRMVQNTGAN